MWLSSVPNVVQNYMKVLQKKSAFARSVVMSARVQRNSALIVVLRFMVIKHHLIWEKSHTALPLIKTLIYILILVPIILIGGYFVNNHIQEKNRIEKDQIEENERTAEIERKRIEEELAKPSNIFNNLLSQNQNKWIGKNILEASYVNLNKNRVFCLYFYPIGKNSGQVSFIDFSSNFDAYSTAYSCKVPYTIQDDYIIFTAKYNPGLEGGYKLDDFMLQIQPIGNNVRLVRTKNGKTQVFDKFTQNISDPIK